MIAPLAKLADWALIQVMTLPWEIQARSAQKRRDAGQIAQADSDLAGALQLLRGPDFLPTDSAPARVEFDPDGSGLNFRFPTPRPSGCAENNTVWGRLYRCRESW